MPSRASSSVDLKLAVSCGLTLIKIAKQYLLCKMHDHSSSFHFYCLLSAVLRGSNMCNQVSSLVYKLEMDRLSKFLHVLVVLNHSLGPGV